jgi:flagellar assembly protein FliH
VVAAVRNVVRERTAREALTLRVCPTDHALLMSEREHLLEGHEGASVSIVADERVRLGGCMLETSAGTLDGRMEVQLQRLHDLLLSTRARRAAEPESGEC